MKYLNIENLKASRIILGCMRTWQLSINDLEKLILRAVELGINFFDHADIYGGGKVEELFGEVLKRNADLRSKIIIQSKCGICKGFYDNSKEHIIFSVDNILKRLNTDYLDVLLIHRPDALMDVNEMGEAFNKLYQNKKVRYFGVSNMNSMQMELLQKSIDKKLLFNQIQMSIVHSPMIDAFVNVNMRNEGTINRDGSILEYSQLNGITIQAWSVLLASWEEGIFLNHDKYKDLNDRLTELSDKYQVTPSAIAVAWIMRHPAQIMPIVGTTSINHLEDIVKAANIDLTRQEWYDLYLSTGKKLP